MDGLPVAAAEAIEPQVAPGKSIEIADFFP